MQPTAHDITTLLLAWGAGDRAALDRLTPLVYDELHRLAASYMRRERAGQTLEATALIHEAWMRLIDVRQVEWQNRAHFFGMAARVMRQILVAAARDRGWQKRGGGTQRISLDEALVIDAGRDEDLVALDEALQALAAFDARKAQVVEMRFFGGLTEAEIAATLHVSTETVRRDWRLAKAWLLHKLDGAAPDGS